MAVFTPSSSQSIYISSLTETLSRDIWKSLNMGTSRFSTRTVPVYVWDLYSLANSIGGLNGITKNDPWHVMWVNSFNDSAGNVYSSAPSVYPVAFYDKYDLSRNTYGGSLSLAPLLTGATPDGVDSESYGAEVALYKSVVYPAYPVMLASSISANTHFGPCFISDIEFNVTGERELAPVEINVSFVGGKSIQSPLLDVSLPETVTLNNGEDYRTYRTASLLDCLAYNGVFKNVEEFKNALISVVAAEILNPQTRLISMNLKMSQNVEFGFTAPAKGFTDESGPHYASVSEREVSGEFTYYSLSSKGNPLGLYINNDSNSVSISNVDSVATVSMYFGGPFLFAMPNVQFQNPTSSVQAGKGFMHTYSFVARSAITPSSSVSSMAFTGSQSPSEFVINDYGKE